ncbi:hypothetical protein DEO72_LG8g2575 [Vigna unguiculata]|uniref:Uncharacterized protein n=1 Tax=Vigna unguiculata TaxID=3917 RepID=A0A4D6MWN5_VIGUN|nr:hypothetical protein DEO72_LG8g2575 [Vigna unguiculata]
MLAGVIQTMFFPGLIHRLAEDRLPPGDNVAPVAFWGLVGLVWAGCVIVRADCVIVRGREEIGEQDELDT